MKLKVIKSVPMLLVIPIIIPAYCGARSNGFPRKAKKRNSGIYLKKILFNSPVNEKAPDPIETVIRATHNNSSVI